MKTVLKAIDHIVFRLLYLASLAVTYFYGYPEILIVVLFIPFFTYSVSSFLEYNRILGTDNYIMLTKSNLNLQILFVPAVAIILCYAQWSVFSGVLLALSLVALFLDYTVLKRKMLIIATTGINQVGKDKPRYLSEITAFDTYPKSVMITFNNIETLQINRHELLHPEWDTLLVQLATVKNLQSNSL